MPRPALLLSLFLMAAPALAAPSSEGAVTGFVRSDRADAFGYYLPEGTIRTGRFELKVLAIATPDEFDAFERAPGRAPAPITLQFDDIASQQKTNELGAQYYTRSIRAAPSAYRIGRDEIHFLAKDRTLGIIIFDGRIDRALMARVRARGPNGSQDVVLKGNLSVGQTVFKNTRFTWFGGD